MGQVTKEIEKMEELADLEYSDMQMEIFTLVIGKMIKLVVLELINILTGHVTQANGKTICRMGLELKRGPMGAVIMDFTKVVKSKDLDIMYGLINPIIEVNDLIIKLMEKELTGGQTADVI